MRMVLLGQTLIHLVKKTSRHIMRTIITKTMS